MRVRSSLSLAVLLFAFLGSACSDDASEAPNAPPGTNDADAGTDADNGSDGDTDADANPNPASLLEDSFVRVPLHGSVEVKIAVTRSGDANGEIQLSIQGDLPKGVSLSATELTIPAGENEAVVTFSSNDEVEALGVESTLQIAATFGDLSDEATLKIEVAAIVTNLDGDGPGSLRDMIESAPLLAEHPTIGFAEAVFPESEGPHVIELQSPIEIGKSLSIEAPTTVSDEPFIVIDAKETGRVLDIRFAVDAEDKKVALSGLQIQGGKSDENGGCIYSEEADLTLEKVVVAQCQGKRGGGLDASGFGRVRIENSTFRGNVASEHGGGAAVQGPHWIENSLFEANESGATGGGLFARWWGETKKTRFIDNRAKDLGGAIRAHSLTTDLLKIEDSHFEGNYAHSGGAISAVSPATIRASTFHKNHARDERGGAIVKHGNPHELSIDSAIFTENSALKFGGAIAANDGSTIDITNSRFQKNSSEDGGALYLDGAEAKVLSSVFEENTVTNRGGAIAVGTGQLRLVKSTLSGNKAFTGAAVFLEASSSSSLIGLSTIANNFASYGGGISLHITGTGSLFIEYSTIADNYATYGGGISLPPPGTGNPSSESSTIANSAASGGGMGAQFADSAKLALRGSIVAQNRLAVGGKGPDIFANLGNEGVIVSNGYNLLGSLEGSRTTCADVHAADECEVDPKLGSLADNGGSMETILLNGDSPGVDVIPNASCSESSGKTIWPDWDELASLLEKDQRELPRPSGARCDIGAVETQ